MELNREEYQQLSTSIYRKYQRASRAKNQERLLLNRLEELKVRFKRAQRDGCWPHCSALGFQLSAVNQVMLLYREYAARTMTKAYQMEAFLQEHFEEYGGRWEEEDQY